MAGGGCVAELGGDTLAVQVGEVAVAGRECRAEQSRCPGDVGAGDPQGLGDVRVVVASDSQAPAWRRPAPEGHDQHGVCAELLSLALAKRQHQVDSVPAGQLG